MRFASYVNFFGRQLSLVNKAYAGVGTFKSFDHNLFNAWQLALGS
jgi:hypothetical protein